MYKKIYLITLVYNVIINCYQDNYNPYKTDFNYVSLNDMSAASYGASQAPEVPCSPSQDLAHYQEFSPALYKTYNQQDQVRQTQSAPVVLSASSYQEPLSHLYARPASFTRRAISADVLTPYAQSMQSLSYSQPQYVEGVTQSLRPEPIQEEESDLEDVVSYAQKIVEKVKKQTEEDLSKDKPSIKRKHRYHPFALPAREYKLQIQSSHVQESQYAPAVQPPFYQGVTRTVRKSRSVPREDVLSAAVEKEELDLKEVVSYGQKAVKRVEQKHGTALAQSEKPAPTKTNFVYGEKYLTYKEPLRSQFGSHEEFITAWTDWRQARDKNNEEVRKSRARRPEKLKQLQYLLDPATLDQH